MDSLTHLLVGHAMGSVASSAAAQPMGGPVYWAVLIGNSLPDIDVPISLLLRRGIRLHRTFTHTLPGASALSAVAAACIGRVMPGTPFWLLFVWTLLGCFSHMALDCLNLFGARPFWPFSGRSIDLGVLHIFDPALVVLLGVPALLVATKAAPPYVLSGAFLWMWPYVLYRIARARRLYRGLKATGSVRARIVPWYSSWRYIMETATAIEFGYWQRGCRRIIASYPKQDSPVVRATLTYPQVSDFLAAAEYPYARVEEDADGFAVIWADALRQLRADFRPLRVRVGD
ncbi:MAG TPA: metal-dependent hydrolase [Symbiobacteriaceae bacterium]|jgi:inner membrane protein